MALLESNLNWKWIVKQEVMCQTDRYRKRGNEWERGSYREEDSFSLCLYRESDVGLCNSFPAIQSPTAQGVCVFRHVFGNVGSRLWQRLWPPSKPWLHWSGFSIINWISQSLSVHTESHSGFCCVVFTVAGWLMSVNLYKPVHQTLYVKVMNHHTFGVKPGPDFPSWHICKSSIMDLY